MRLLNVQTKCQRQLNQQISSCNCVRQRQSVGGCFQWLGGLVDWWVGGLVGHIRSTGSSIDNPTGTQAPSGCGLDDAAKTASLAQSQMQFPFIY